MYEFLTAAAPSGVWVRDLDALEWRKLPGTEGASAIFWSPDSRFLAYTKTAITRQPAIWIYAVDEGKARALTSGRYHVSFDDIRAVAHSVMRHRVLTNFHAQSEGITSDSLIDKLLESVPNSTRSMPMRRNHSAASASVHSPGRPSRWWPKSAGASWARK